MRRGATADARDAVSVDDRRVRRSIDYNIAPTAAGTRRNEAASVRGAAEPPLRMRRSVPVSRRHKIGQRLRAYPATADIGVDAFRVQWFHAGDLAWLRRSSAGRSRWPPLQRTDKPMEAPPITRQSIEHALQRLLRCADVETRADEISVAVTQYNTPALFAVIVTPRLRDVLSQSLMRLMGRRWAPHWEVWILNETDARMLVLDASRAAED